MMMTITFTLNWAGAGMMHMTAQTSLKMLSYGYYYGWLTFMKDSIEMR
jgi:hypothetical protein